ncbi:LLM class flavin-dependent oxidoreductase [Curtobacterium flaccumfaciens]|nr:LLM class flavin-dependent oxidoreductase [Curtobacterium flaccumfaciens]
MRFGYWTPLFGGWLRNVDNENMPVTFDYVKRLAQRAERIGFDLTLVPELNLNDIKGTAAPSLEAWSLAAAIAATTERLEIMAAMRPGYHLPAVTAKQAATIDDISCGRFTFNVVSAWWAGRGEAVRRDLLGARRPVQAHRGVRRGHEGPVARDPVLVLG